ncbi:DCK1 [Candida pseudojiufengensis]|uniref:DCK1 n=1 Tax=Candida pseudojiufengensis TaxID=497109 RepID=UPI0022251195|nr:DCK1 [Candida pseudojiufengensis]KAI5964885.1 DCK1 [Candida pseudojiufengensis]
MPWTSTESFLKGKIIKPFLPNEKHPNLRNPHFQHLYPGDQVLIFEIKDSKWARGYVFKKPMPHDYVAASFSLNDLPVRKEEILIFPLKYVKITDEIPFPKLQINQDFNNIVDSNQIPSIKQSELNYQEATDGNAQGNTEVTSLPIPSLPINLDENENLYDEIKFSLELLTSQIFALYSMGEFKLFNKLSSIYLDLYETRTKLMYDLLTKEETQIARESANFLLNKISKKLASKSARMSSESHDLENEGNDVAGYKSILSRDSNTGTLLNLKNSTPSRIALNSECEALVPKFPINAHNNAYSYSLKPPPNKKFNHEPPSHILVDFRSVSGSSGYSPPGFAGTTAYMYLRNSKKRLTEAFAVHTDSVDDLVHVEKISAAMFRNVPATEIINNRVYLVAVLTEEIDLNLKSNNQIPTLKRVKKGIAAGVADITRIFSQNEGSLTSGEAHNFSIKLFGSYLPKKGTTRGTSDKTAENNGWGELVDRIIAGSSHGVAINPRAEKLVVTVKEFKHQFNGTSSDQISLTAPIARIKPIFYDPLAENYERIYLKMGKVVLLNNNLREDLLTFEVSTPNNDLITFAKASNQQEKRYWQFISVFPGEVIGEIIKVNNVAMKNKKIAVEDHIILSLFLNGTLIGEGKLLYKSGNRLVEFNKRKTHTIEIKSSGQNIPVAHIELSTEYVGKIYNSDVSIDNLFKYESLFNQGINGVNSLSNSLNAFTKLDISQLVKYFPELLTSLYGIVDISNHETGNEIEILKDNTFKAIIHLLDTLFGKQDQYLHLVDDFLSKFKRSDVVGIFLLDKLTEVFANANVNWNSLSRSVCRTMAILMRLAIGSINSNNHRDAYFQSLNSLFKAVAYFLSVESVGLIDDQVLILDIIDYVFAFRTNMEDSKILQLMITFINSLGVRGTGADELNYDGSAKSKSKDHKLVISKLLLILRLLHTSLVDNKETRSILISMSVQWVMEVFLGPTDVEATRLGCSIINSVCTIMWERIIPYKDEDEIELCYSLAKFLPPLSRTFIKYNKFTRGNEFFKPKRNFTQLFPVTYPFNTFTIDQVVNDEVMVEVLVELAVCFSFVARVGKEAAGNEGYDKILNTTLKNDYFDPEKYLANNFQTEDLLTVISGIKYIRQGKYFPEDKWLSLYSVIIDGCLCALELIRPLILTYQLPPIEQAEAFDRILWGNYLKTLMKLAVLPVVAVEHLSTVPKKACAAITNDVRNRAAYLINEAWDSLAWESTEEDVIRFSLNKFGGYQVEFINEEFGIIPELMIFGLQRNVECQSVAVKILWSIIISEYILSDNLKEVEKQCLLGLYDIYQKVGYNPSKEDMDNFLERLKATIRLDREDEAFNVIYGFIKSITAFCSTLSYYASVPVGPEFDEDRAFHNVKLRAQIKTAGKPELFNSFINAMYEYNISKNDFVQGALSLELIASTYEWDHNKIVPASYKPKFPEQTSFERKEILYKMIANNFVKGNSLEKAADTFNELLDSYNEHTYDLKSFAYVHNKLSQLYLDLESSDKLEPSYFRVEAIGTGFPMYMRVISQIYQGLPFEHITSVHERLLKVFPGAIIVSDDSEAQKLKEEGGIGRFLYVKAVEPVFEFSDKLFNTTLGVRQYARNKDLRFFTSLKKIPGSTSVFDLWTEQTTYEAWLSFPTLMNRSFIKGSTTIRLSPIDNAIRTVTKRNDDLITLENLINVAIKDKTDYSEYFNDLSRQLSGTVDAPVNGGVNQYRLFFTDSKYQDTEEDHNKAKLLSKAFKDLAIILNRCLILHGKLVPTQMKVAHTALLELFHKNFAIEIESLRLTTEDAPPSQVAPASRVSIFQDKRSNSSMFDKSSASNYNYAQSQRTASINGSSIAGGIGSTISTTTARLFRSNTNSSTGSNKSNNARSENGNSSRFTSSGFSNGTTNNYNNNSSNTSAHNGSMQYSVGGNSQFTNLNHQRSMLEGSNGHSGNKKSKPSGISKSTAVNGTW